MCGCGCELIAAQAMAKAEAQAAKVSTTTTTGQPDADWRGWWAELKALVHEIAPSQTPARRMRLEPNSTAPISGSAL